MAMVTLDSFCKLDYGYAKRLAWNIKMCNDVLDFLVGRPPMQAMAIRDQAFPDDNVQKIVHILRTLCQMGLVKREEVKSDTSITLDDGRQIFPITAFYQAI